MRYQKGFRKIGLGHAANLAQHDAHHIWRHCLVNGMLWHIEWGLICIPGGGKPLVQAVDWGLDLKVAGFEDINHPCKRQGAAQGRGRGG